MACEINLGANAPCNIQNDKPRTLIDSHLPFFFNYLQTESTSQTEGLGLDTPSSYGAGWSIARWTTDQYAGEAEGTFIKSLINEPSLTGLANLTAHTGQSSTLLLTYWNVATAIFETPNFAFADPRATTPSFNFADIFKVGQSNLTCNGVPCGLFTRSGTPTFPIQPIPLTSGTFSNSIVGVPGTSAVFYLLSATSGSYSDHPPHRDHRRQPAVDERIAHGDPAGAVAMRRTTSIALMATACLTAVAMSACHHDPAAGSGAPTAEKIDSLEGIVRVVGSTGSSAVTLRTDDAQSLTIDGAPSLSRLSGLRVRVRGNRTAHRLNVSGFRVISANGVTAHDGTLATDGSQLVLLTEDGQRLPVARPAAGLRAAIGHRVWISGPLDGETVAYGVIE